MSMCNKALIAIAGENLIDTVVTQLPSGERVITDSLGGSPYNVAVAMGRQGQRPYYVTPISTDDFGNQLHDNLTRQGVHATGQRRVEPSSQAIVTIKNGIPDYKFKRDGTAERCVSVSSIEDTIPRELTHFHLGSLALVGGEDAAIWEKVFHALAKKGITTSLDPNVRPSLIDDPDTYRDRMMRLFASATIIKFSDEDLSWIFPNVTQLEAIEQLTELSDASFIVLTKGPDGAECWTPNAHLVMPNLFAPKLVDTIGAGDTFMATILSDLAKQNHLSSEWFEGADMADLQMILKRALCAACLNCEKEGCDPPTAASIEAAIN